ncbi:MAG: hypothetical protein A4E49_03173 [Methanosaeta sp. PtaU1.Bin112]|nr:MAG: hypothetical protein A4E49_03173 [Methanosaeta sp. PtaU1.Bin112]
MPRLSLKTDSSFYRKIAMGAIGVRAVCADLASYGHDLVELERGSSESKIWKDVKRKRVRIPDLVCKKCGTRIECRAKNRPELSMSHTATVAERSWDYGMVDSDWIAFPICQPVKDKEEEWSSGQIKNFASYWNERNWILWHKAGKINYFTVNAFRSVPSDKSSTKGVTEGSETSITWSAIFSTRNGRVKQVSDEGIKVIRNSDNRPYTWKIKPGQMSRVIPGQIVEECQILASGMPILTDKDLTCPGTLPDGLIQRLLDSRERTQRFTGIKLAKLHGFTDYREKVHEVVDDREEDIYVRLEGASYLSSICEVSTKTQFMPFLSDADLQNRLEAVITLGETETEESTEILGDILNDPSQAGFMRSASAWSLGKIGTERAQKLLVNAFTDINKDLREDALENIITLGNTSLNVLLDGIRRNDEDIAAGCAEAIRQCDFIPISALENLASYLERNGQDEVSSRWIVWLLGQMPIEPLVPAIARLQDSKPELHYAMSVLWSFVNSWISKHWEMGPWLKEYINDE